MVLFRKWKMKVEHESNALFHSVYMRFSLFVYFLSMISAGI